MNSKTKLKLKNAINFLLIPLIFVSVVFFGALHANAEGGVYVNSNTFPDADFRKYVENNFATKRSGQYYISDTEIQNVTIINLNNQSNIKNITGVEKFPNLKELYLSQCTNLESLDISYNTKLEKLTVTNTKLKTLNVSNNTQLKSLSCQVNQISQLNLTKNTKLEELYCRGNNLKSLDLSGNPNLKTVDCHNNVMTGLDISKCTKLTFFDCTSNQFTGLDFGANVNLTELYCGSNKLTSINVVGCKKLKYFDCSNNSLSEINLDDSVALVQLDCSNNKLNKLNTKNATLLEELICYQNSFTDLVITKNGTMDKNLASASSKTETVSGNNKTVKYTLNNKVILWKDEKATIYKLDTNKTAETPMNEAEIRKLVTRFYFTILGREPEAGGVDYHTQRLMKKEIDGAGLSRGFVMSAEFENLNLTNDEFIRRLYDTYFQRTPSDSEIQYWTNTLTGGKSREYVLSGFVNSKEFDDICKEYGINRGTFVVVKPDAPKPSGTKTRTLKISAKNVNDQQVTSFISSLYTKILGRNGGDNEIAYWKEAAINGKAPDGVVYNASTIPRCGFFAASEYKNLNKSEEEFVKDAYHAFLGRDAGADEIAYWKDQLNKGTYTRDSLLDIGFGTSDEFQNILRGYGFEVTLVVQ